MPRYYFHLNDGVDRVDAEGTELPDDKSAWREAVEAFPGMLRERAPEPGETYTMSVCQDDGAQVYELRFAGSRSSG